MDLTDCKPRWKVRRRRGVVAGVVAGAVALGFAPVAAGAPEGAQATVSLRSGVSGRCVDVPGFATADGTQIALWDCNGGANQQWTTSGSGPVTIAGKCLDVATGPAGAATPGTRVVLWSCRESAASQSWTLSTSQPGKITNASGLCLDTAMGTGGNAVPLVVWPCVDSKSQVWTPR
ncbi:ricin-type beta-trefoil lectin domain protein [Actinokineospora sp. NPDC004072]